VDRMARIGIFYSTRTGGTERVARLLRRELAPAEVDLHDVGRTDPGQVAHYDLVILGAPTWAPGSVPEEWDRFTTAIGQQGLASRKVALFGLGDAGRYPAHYVDAMGVLYGRVVAAGAEVIGSSGEIEVRCYRSRALRDARYVGLPLDEDNRPELVYHSVRQWARALLDEAGCPDAPGP
jgi:flavodoxin long chain